MKFERIADITGGVIVELPELQEKCLRMLRKIYLGDTRVSIASVCVEGFDEDSEPTLRIVVDFWRERREDEEVFVPLDGSIEIVYDLDKNDTSVNTDILAGIFYARLYDEV